MNKPMRGIKLFFYELGEISLLLKEIIISAVTPPFKWKYVSDQLVHIGVGTLPLVSLMAVFVGMVTAYMAYHQFKMVQLEMYTGSLVGIVIAMELGPVFTAIIIAGRIGSSTAAQISSMKTTEQLDALEMMAISPIKYLAVPRFIAVIIMVPILTIFADFIGLFGGYMVGVWKFGIRHTIYLNKTWEFLHLHDVVNGIIKTIFFGMIIILISCYKGFTASEGAEGVGKATISAVVLSCIAILVVDYFLTVILF